MATFQQIKEDIQAAVAASPLLSAISNPSSTSLVNAIFDMVARIIFKTQELFDAHAERIREIQQSQRIATPAWWVARAKEFQFGQQVIATEGVVKYNTIDKNLQIVKFSAATTTVINGKSTLILKVAAADANGLPTPLNTQQIDAFRGYVTRIKPAGVNINTVSIQADRLRIAGELFYNPLFTPQTALNQFNQAALEYIQNLIDFDGKFVVNDFIKRVREEPAISNYTPANLVGISGADETIFTTEYESVSGYFKYDDAPFDLETLTILTPTT